MTEHCEADRLSFSTNIAFDSETSCLSQIRRYVEGVSQRAGLDPDRAFDLKVAVSEACANAVEHSGNEGACLQLRTSCLGNRMEIEITDRGGFRLPSAMDGQRRMHRGLGLPLMVALVDEVRICRLPQGGTRVTLSMYRGQGARCPEEPTGSDRP